jgi:pimeloyl-ACP methyl ester carboxylesterase
VRTADAAIFFVASLLALCALLANPIPVHADQSAIVAVSGTLVGNAIWSPSNGIYEVFSDITIPASSSLTILPGTIVKMNYQASIINQGILAIGGVGARTFVTSIADDSVGGDTNADGTATSPALGNWGRIETSIGAVTEVENATLRYSGWNLPPRADMFLNSGGILSIKDSTLSDDVLLINNVAGTTTISTSSLTDTFYGVYRGGGSVDARNDWWGDPSGPEASSNPGGEGSSVWDGVAISPWLTQDPDTICSAGCESNVLFIPGIESSRLYTSPGGSESQLWEPGFFSNQADVKSLYLDPSGRSINPIYTKADGAIDTEGTHVIGGITLYSDDVYKTFLAQLAGLKASSAIADYLVFPYDWRLSPADIVNDGARYDDGTHYLDEALVTLAATSKTGKVTIVAHSNGGLVAKALMMKLQSEGRADLVDKVILVDVPQTGTPKAAASMLHGDFQKIPDAVGFMVSEATARGLAENMPDAYDLLPSSAYFASVATPVVDLSSAPTLKSTSGIATNTITSAAALASFLTGSGGRAKPAFADTETPDVLSPTLLSNAASIHASLDAWQPPLGVQVIQIAGWGIDTPSEITYSEVPHTQCQTGTCTTVEATRHIVDMTEDGDGTVVIPSQVATTSWVTYYININKFNNDAHTNFSHGNITDALPFANLLDLILASTSPQLLPNYVSPIEPQQTSLSKSLRLRVLSPVTLDAYDNLGNHTGIAPNPNPLSDDIYVEEQIPGSYYQQYGEGQYIGLPADGSYTVKLHGTDTGTFTFEVTPVSGGVAGAPVTFADVPVTASSSAIISLAGNVPASTTLALDVNGDGVIDTTIASSTQTSDPLAYAKLVRSSIALMDIGAPVQKQLQAKLANMIYLLTKVDQWDTDDDDVRDTSKTDKVVVRVVRKLGKVETYLQNEIGKPVSKRIKDERITAAQAAAITDMIEELKLLVNAKQL